jgi:hypothetical protein
MATVVVLQSDELGAWIGVAGVAVGVVLAAGIDWWRSRRAERKQKRLELLRARQLNESLAEFKAGVVIVETAPTKPAARRVARPVRETAQARPTPRRAASEPAKVSKRERRVAKIVRETLTAAASPKPAPGTGTAAKPAVKAPAKSPHLMSDDELAAATVSGVGGASPFWRPRESAPAAPITESTDRDVADRLAKLSNDELDGVFDRLNQRRGLASPLWAAA